jgi:hypothetical protein
MTQFKVGDTVIIRVARNARVMDVDPPSSLEGYVLIDVPGEIPSRWWVLPEDLLPAGD